MRRGVGMLPYVRIEDLGVGDFVKVDCTACHRVALLTAEGVLRAGRRSELDRSQFDPIFGPIWRERSSTALTVSSGSRAQMRLRGGPSWQTRASIGIRCQ